MQRRWVCTKPSAFAIISGCIDPTVASVKAVLAASPKGVYTTVRSIEGGTALLMFEQHLKRLEASIKSVMPAHTGCIEEVIGCVHRDVFVGAKEHQRLSPEEFRASVVVAPASDTTCQVAVFFEQLPPPPASPVFVELARAQRADPASKDVEWARARRRLEEEQSLDANETLLVDRTGEITEGLQSNWFVVREDGVHTAPPTRVLGGTIRDLVLRTCKASSIPVTLRCPRVDEAATWKSAFLTSTSRLVLPVQALRLHKKDGPIVEFKDSHVLATIMDGVRDNLSLSSTRVDDLLTSASSAT